MMGITPVIALANIVVKKMVDTWASEVWVGGNTGE